MLNLFYELSKFTDVDPGFMPDYKPSCTTDPLFNEQWGLHTTPGINICDAWNITKGDPNIIVAVIDEGIDPNHSEFAENFYHLSYDAVNNSSPSRVYGDHGMHVAGIIGANQNSLQISGVAPRVSLMSISHSFGSGVTISQEFASAISYAWQNGASVINNSWSANFTSTLIDDAISNALANGRNGLGCVVIFASGNQGANTPAYPARNNSKVLIVGSINSQGKRAINSNYPGNYGVVAPGVNILSTFRNNQVAFASDTSMATPHVSGIAALILSMDPILPQERIREIIITSTKKLPDYSNIGTPYGGWNQEVGFGLVDAYAALRRVNSNYTLSGPGTIWAESIAQYSLPSAFSNYQQEALWSYECQYNYMRIDADR